MTSGYTPPEANFGPDIFQLDLPGRAPDQWRYGRPEQSRQLLPAAFQTFKVPAPKGALGFRVTFSDFGGGLAGGGRGDLEQAYNALDSSDAHSWDFGNLTLPFYRYSQDLGGYARIPYRTCHANIFGRLAIGNGGGTSGGVNRALYRETSDSDPTLINTTYDSGANENIACLHPVIIGGIGAAVRLLVGRSTSAAQILSNLNTPPTVDGTMHANTAQCYGAIQTPLPDLPILLYANATISSVKATAAIGAAPTVTLSNVPIGGYALGLLSMGGARMRAWWVWPKTGSGYFTPLLDLHPSVSGFAVAGAIVSTNLEGTDQQELRTPLTRVILATIVRNGIVASDGFSIWYSDGRSHWFMPFPPDVSANSNNTWRCQGFYVRGDDFFVEANVLVGPNAVAETRRFVLHYDWGLNRFHQVSATELFSQHGVVDAPRPVTIPGDSLPVSAQTGFFHCFDFLISFFHRGFQPLPSRSVFSQRQTAGSDAATGREFEASATASTPYLWLPKPYAGRPFNVRRIIFRGDADAGGAAGSEAMVQIDVNGRPSYFVPGFPNQAQVDEIPDDELSQLGQLQVNVTLTRQASNTRLTPQALPFDIEGYIFMEETPAPPYQVESEA